MYVYVNRSEYGRWARNAAVLPAGGCRTRVRQRVTKCFHVESAGYCLRLRSIGGGRGAEAAP